jgi:hypothetical protein
MKNVEWKRQRNKIAKLRFGAKQEADDERTIVVEEGNAILARIDAKSEVTFENGKGIHAILSLVEKNNLQVELTVPTMLQTELGWNPKHTKDFVAKEGSLVKITYLGRDQKTKAFRFDVEFGFEEQNSQTKG